MTEPMTNHAEAQIAEYESRQWAYDEALLDEIESGRHIDQMLAEAQGQSEDAFFDRWGEMSSQEKHEYASLACPGFDSRTVVHDIDESAHYRACPDRAACCRCSGCEGGIPCKHWASEAVAEYERRDAEEAARAAADRERWEAERRRSDAEIDDLQHRVAQAIARREAADQRWLAQVMAMEAAEPGWLAQAMAGVMEAADRSLPHGA